MKRKKVRNPFADVVDPVVNNVFMPTLPKGGPDRARVCLWYADAMDKPGATHEDALRSALGALSLMRVYIQSGLASSLGPVVGGVPIEFQGEGETQ